MNDAHYDPPTYLVPDYGDVMPMADFVDCVSTGSIMNDDGSGCYSKDGKTYEPDKRIDCRNIDDSYAFVVWFNK